MTDPSEPTRGPRRTARERREEVIAVAIVEFATHGLHGASTETIAKRAGISQPYVLRLFGTKLALFIAAVRAVEDQIMATWERALSNVDPALDPEQRLHAIGAYYQEMMREEHGLRLLLQSFSSSDVPEVRKETHRCMKGMYEWIAINTEASGEAIQRWFAYGMLMTVAAAIGAPAVADDESWARILSTVPVEE